MDIYTGLFAGTIGGFILSFVKKDLFLSIYYTMMFFSVFLLFLFSLIVYRSNKYNQNTNKTEFILFVSLLFIPFLLK